VAFLARVCAVCIFFAGAVQAQQYFPPGVFDEKARGYSSKVDDWYSKHLKALGEPSLWELSQKDRTAEVYRFLWLRTFHHPVSVRIVIFAKAGPFGRARLLAKVATGAAGYKFGHVNRSRSTNLMDGSVRKLLERIESVKFWTQPAYTPVPADVVQLDGAEWIIEGIKGGQYHVIDRWSPEPVAGDAAYILGTMMAFDLARLRIKKSEIY
jgi:hypothetical protein